MFITVIKTFFRFVIVFGLFILGFSFSFYMLLQNQGPFDSFSKTVVKTIVMMIGEYEYEGIFELFRSDYEDPDFTGEWSGVNFYHPVTYLEILLYEKAKSLSKIQTFVKKRQKVLFRVPIFCQKSKLFLSKFQIFVKIPNFCQNSKFLSKFKNFVKNSNLCQKSKAIFLSKVSNKSQKSILGCHGP